LAVRLAGGLTEIPIFASNVADPLEQTPTLGGNREFSSGSTG
jgi:hypothetical protein